MFIVLFIFLLNKYEISFHALSRLIRGNNVTFFDYQCLKSLGHYLRPHISKTVMHDSKFETYLERNKFGNHLVIIYRYAYNFLQSELTCKRNDI